MGSVNMNQMDLQLDNFIVESKKLAGMFMCTAGYADIIVNNQVFHLKRGGLYIISPLVMICKVSQSSDFGGIYITDELEVFYSVIHSIIDTIIHINLRNSPCIQLSDNEVQFVVERKSLIEAKKEEYDRCIIEEEKKLIKGMIHLLEQETLLEIIRIYLKNSLVDSHPIEKKESIVYKFIYSLHNNFKKQRSVTFYANEAKLSTGYFSNVVKGMTGRTPSEWIISITIAQAKLLLEKSKRSIKEISAELNFPEQFTFRKYFKQHTGMAPKEYRLKKQVL